MKLDVIYLTEEQADKLRGQTGENGLKFNPVADAMGRLFVTTTEVEDSGIDWLEELESVTIDTERMARQALLEQLTNAAEASGLNVPCESFYYTHRNTISSWLLDGGDSLKSVFESATDAWLDLRESDEQLSPREFALKLLNA